MPTAANGQLIEKPKAPVPVTIGSKGAEPDSIESLWRLCNIVHSSGIGPKSLATETQLVVAALYGRELGMTFMQSLQSIAVIEGKPALYGDAAMSLVRSSGVCEYVHESIEGDGDSMKAVCVSKRKDCPQPVRTEFSVADAKAAKLWGKRTKNGYDTPWVTYPKRMLQMRARGYNLRDNFADKLSGIRTVEELQDIEEPQMQSGSTIGTQELDDIVDSELLGAAGSPATQAVAASEPFVGDPRLPTKEELQEMAEAATVQDELPF